MERGEKRLLPASGIQDALSATRLLYYAASFDAVSRRTGTKKRRAEVESELREGLTYRFFSRTFSIHCVRINIGLSFTGRLENL